MPQTRQWEQEYKNSKFVTKHDKPQHFVIQFIKFLRRKAKIDIDGINVLDLGCGTGRNSNHLASLGANVIGTDIARNALQIAKERAKNEKINNVKYINSSIGDKYSFDDNYFDLALDVLSSNALNNKEREIYLEETNRVLKKGSYLLVKALCKEGDKNAKFLLKQYPGKEENTYIMPETNLTEKVWTKDDIVKFYSKYFKIVEIIKETGYPKFGKQSFKRMFWYIYLQKK